MTVQRFGRVLVPCAIGDDAGGHVAGGLVLEIVDGGDEGSASAPPEEPKIVARVMRGMGESAGEEVARFVVDADDLHDASLSLDRFLNPTDDDG